MPAQKEAMATMETGVELFASTEDLLDEIEQSWESEEWLSDGFGGLGGGGPFSPVACNSPNDCNSQVRC